MAEEPVYRAEVPMHRETLEELAASLDLVFRPLEARFEGKQVFALGGKLQVFIDPQKGLIFSRKSASSTFVRTSLQDLVHLASSP